MASYYVLFSLLLLPVLLVLKSSISKTKYRLPPGPWTLPIVGSIHHLVGRGLPHHVLRTLSRRYGQLMLLQLGEIPTLVVSSKEAAREVMKTHDLKFCTRPFSPIAQIMFYNLQDVVFTPYGEYWRERRKVCVLQLLTAKRVQSFKFIREETTKSLIQQIRSLSSAGQLVDISDKVQKLSNVLTLQAIMGSKQNVLLSEIQTSIELLTGFDVATLFPSSRLARNFSRVMARAQELHRNIDRLFDGIIREHRMEQEEDEGAETLLSVLLRLHDEGSANSKISMDSIKATIIDLIVAGTDSSGSMLVWAMAELMRSPRVMKKVQTELRQHLEGPDNITNSNLNELNYFQLVIKETLRLHPSLPLLLQRECRETCNILGYDIPKGTAVIVNAWALGRDSNYWKDAEEFKPERFEEESSNVSFHGGDFEFLPFGAGRRICPGMTFGLATIELVLGSLLYHFNWELPHGMKPEEVDMTERLGITAGKKYPLCLRPIPYKY